MSDDSHEYDEDALEFIEDERVRLAALHATCPNEIWLQIDPEAEQFDGWDAQTWCSDKINETDVRYVRAASRDAEIAELRAELAAALAACKVKDEALRAANHSCVEDWPLLRNALAIQPDDAALKAWLGNPVSYLYKHSSAFGGGEFWSHITTHNGVTAIESKALYAPKELK